MTYLAGQIFFCLLIAALIGGIIGWLLKSLASRGRIARLEGDLESTQNDYQAALGERDGLSRDLDSASGKLRDVEASLAAASSEKATLASNLDTSQGKLAEVEASLATESGETSSLGEKLEGARGQVAELEASLTAATGEKTSLTESLEGARGRVSELEAALVAMTAERDQAAEARASAAASAGADSEASAALRTELAQAQRDLAEAQGALARCRDDLASAATPSAAPAVAPVPLMSTPDEAASGESRKDDLKKVEGVGPKIEGLLNDGGIHTWAQLAAAPVDRLQSILDAAGERYRIHDPRTWPQQAQLAADGLWDELESLQDRLTGGR